MTDPIQVAVDLEVDQIMAEFELAERNADAIRAWRLRRALGMHHPDAWSPTWRSHWTLWFSERQINAKRWLVMNRMTQTDRMMRAGLRASFSSSLPFKMIMEIYR
jgi:hypothetical protein